MANRIISQGYIGVNLIITQGYTPSITVGGDSAKYYYMKKPASKDKKPLLQKIKQFLIILTGE